MNFAEFRRRRLSRCLRIEVSLCDGFGFDYITLYEIADLYIIEILDGNTAFEALRNFLDVVFESLQGVVACPLDVIALNKEANMKGYNYAWQVKEDTCNGCSSCATVCPDGCISVYKVKVE